jgi:hypothetical protein
MRRETPTRELTRLREASDRVAALVPELVRRHQEPISLAGAPQETPG